MKSVPSCGAGPGTGPGLDRGVAEAVEYMPLLEAQRDLGRRTAATAAVAVDGRGPARCLSAQAFSAARTGKSPRVSTRHW
ncbi:MAG TPA: hypothetical protein VF070_11065 [Streptosporangiaceae bacterium]